MSRGLGRVQLECLRVIQQYEAQGEKPTTFTVAVEVYRVEPDSNGDRMCSEAQHVATKRALTNMRRKGLVSGQQDITVFPDGQRVLSHVGADGCRAERCCLWTILPAGLEVLRNRVREQTAAAPARRLAA